MQQFCVNLLYLSRRDAVIPSDSIFPPCFLKPKCITTYFIPSYCSFSSCSPKTFGQGISTAFRSCHYLDPTCSCPGCNQQQRKGLPHCLVSTGRTETGSQTSQFQLWCKYGTHSHKMEVKKIICQQTEGTTFMARNYQHFWILIFFFFFVLNFICF